MRVCPLGFCDGSGFVKYHDDEDNCAHTDWPAETWTPEAVTAFLWHYNTAHIWGASECRWCSTPGWGKAA